MDRDRTSLGAPPGIASSFELPGGRLRVCCLLDGEDCSSRKRRESKSWISGNPVAVSVLFTKKKSPAKRKLSKPQSCRCPAEGGLRRFVERKGRGGNRDSSEALARPR